jgi:hypothetical protein
MNEQKFQKIQNTPKLPNTVLIFALVFFLFLFNEESNSLSRKIFYLILIVMGFTILVFINIHNSYVKNLFSIISTIKKKLGFVKKDDEAKDEIEEFVT